MLAVVIVGFLAVILTLCIGVFIICGLVDRYYQRAEDRIWAFTASEEGKPSQLAIISDEIAKVLAHRIVERIRSAFMTESSHIQRQENAIKEDVVTDLTSAQSPLAGMLLDQLPSVKKRLARNPSALPALLGLLSHLNLGGGGSAQLSNPDNGSSAFGDLAKWK